MATKTKGSFESALERLEKIVEEMQSSDELNLETRIKRFEEGVALIRECKKSLETAAKKVEVLVGKDKRLFEEVRQRLRETDSGDYEVEEEGEA
ncbi:MAG: exodeoxyribonuclease VII small subunit [Candidatus Omnitrophica bacterium]|nr:exodeoxyribonuclease VII small subunit [Candidatus Omnitrophota bacterium]